METQEGISTIQNDVVKEAIQAVIMSRVQMNEYAED